MAITFNTTGLLEDPSSDTTRPGIQEGDSFTYTIEVTSEDDEATPNPSDITSAVLSGVFPGTLNIAFANTSGSDWDLTLTGVIGELDDFYEDLTASDSITVSNYGTEGSSALFSGSTATAYTANFSIVVTNQAGLEATGAFFIKVVNNWDNDKAVLQSTDFSR